MEKYYFDTDGKRYKTVNREVEEGDFVYIESCEECPETNGRIAVVLELHFYDYGDDPDFEVDIPSEAYGGYSYIDALTDTYYVLELVTEVPEEVEETTVDESQAEPDVLGMLANLARRVTELERQVDTNRNDIRTWAEQFEDSRIEITKNIERHEEHLQMLTDDIVMLDERTDVLRRQPIQVEDPTVTLDGRELGKAIAGFVKAFE